MKARLALLASLSLLASPAPAAQRWWTYIGGCGNADWLGVLAAPNSQGQISCWSTLAGGASGALPPLAADQVFLVNAQASAELLTPLAGASRTPFNASAQWLDARGSASFATGLMVDKGSLRLQLLTLGNELGEAEQRGRLLQNGGSVNLERALVRFGDYTLQSGTLTATEMLLQGNKPRYEQSGGTASFQRLVLEAPATGGDALLRHTGGALSIGALTLNSERLTGTTVDAQAGTSAQVDNLLTTGSQRSFINLGAGTSWQSLNATLAQAAYGVTRMQLAAGASWTVSELLVLASAGEAHLELSGGAQLSTHNTLLANQTMGSGELVLRDAGTRWHNDGVLVIGQARFGTVRVESGATVQSGALVLGDDGNARGALKLDGVGTRWDGGRLTVANVGQGDVTVRNGAQLATTSATVGNNVASSGLVDVRGGQALWAVSGTLSVGGAGSGRLNIGDGGQVQAGTLWMGAGGIVTLDGGSLTLAQGMTLNPGAGFVWQRGLLRYDAGDQQLGQGGLPKALSLGAQQRLEVAERLSLPTGSVLLLAGGSLQAKSLQLNGGVLAGDANGRLDMNSVPYLVGAGTAAVAVSGGTGKEHRIEATGSLLLGDLSRGDGIDFGGHLVVGSHLVSLNDADLAELNAKVFLDQGGRLASVNGIHLASDGVLLSEGSSQVQGAFVNDGRVVSNQGVLSFLGDVSGTGSFKGGVRLLAGFAPGGGTAGVDFGGGDLSLGEHAQLQLALGSGRAGHLRGIDALSLDGTLILQVDAGAASGGVFDLLDFAHAAGRFANVQVHGVATERVDLSQLYSTGEVRIAPVPEPASALLALGGLALLLARRRGLRSSLNTV
ncbi:hypothetical protein [Roseateles paludis]|uniref:PEP-CTERM protein-sorting domain-containing protein n=1 Tax=Roseateles paludis TaxID=3145238 RepID=A0ABV0G1C7_9BURK